MLGWAAIFVCAWCGNQFSPLLVMYEERQHYSSLMANVFLGVYVLGLAPSLLIAGSLSDRHGRKPLMAVAIGAALLGSALLSAGALGPAFLIAGRLCSGIAVGAAMAVGTSWVTELSASPYDPRAESGAGARRASLAFLMGSLVGALVAGACAQWGPLPETVPFLVHIALTIPVAALMFRAPETRASGHGVPGPWWRQLAVPSVAHRRFVRIIVWSAPWLFTAAAIGYGYLPTQLRAVTGGYGLIFATALTVVTLGASTLVQPLAKRMHSPRSGRNIVVSLGVLAAGIAVVAAAVALQSVWVGLASSLVIGAGLGIGLVSGLLEVQQIATSADLAGLTGVFYTLAYGGFLVPSLIAALGGALSIPAILAGIAVLAGVACLTVLSGSRKHLPAR